MRNRKLLVGLLISAMTLGSCMVTMAETKGMEGYNHTYLPIGSVVIMEGGTAPLMIQGYAFTASDSDYIYDYCGCLYPNGFESMEKSYCFDQKDISEVLHIGYIGEDTEEFLSYVDANMANAKAGNGSIEETDAPSTPETTAAPQAEGDNPSVEIVEGSFTIPSNLSSFIAAGWSLVDASDSDIVEASATGSVVMEKNGYKITLYYTNKAGADANIKDVTVYQIDAATEMNNLPLSAFNGSIYTGMSWETFEAYLQEISYDVEKHDGFDTIYFDANHEVSMTVFGDVGGTVWGLNYCDWSAL